MKHQVAVVEHRRKVPAATPGALRAAPAEQAFDRIRTRGQKEHTKGVRRHDSIVDAAARRARTRRVAGSEARIPPVTPPHPPKSRGRPTFCSAPTLSH